MTFTKDTLHTMLVAVSRLRDINAEAFGKDFYYFLSQDWARVRTPTEIVAFIEGNHYMKTANECTLVLLLIQKEMGD